MITTSEPTIPITSIIHRGSTDVGGADSKISVRQAQVSYTTLNLLVENVASMLSSPLPAAFVAYTNTE